MNFEFEADRVLRWNSVGTIGFEEGIKEGKFGAPGKGIEEASAGGMHTLVVDAEGKVSTVSSLALEPLISIHSATDTHLLPLLIASYRCGRGE